MAWETDGQHDPVEVGQPKREPIMANQPIPWRTVGAVRIVNIAKLPQPFRTLAEEVIEANPMLESWAFLQDWYEGGPNSINVIAFTKKENAGGMAVAEYDANYAAYLIDGTVTVTAAKAVTEYLRDIWEDR